MKLRQATARFCRRNAALLALCLLLVPTVEADCAKDSRGEIYCGGGTCVRDRSGSIWCSRFYQGGARTSRDGAVVCGRGQCIRDSRGRVFCSSVVGGTALKDSSGQVRCYGECDAARANWCENTVAGSADAD